MKELKKIIEALLFAAQQPLTAKELLELFSEQERPDLKTIQAACAELMLDYSNHAVELKKVASGYRFQVRAEFASWVSRLFAEKPPKYSRAFLETLAIIAYKQPVTRAEIEGIRGVSISSHIMQGLLEREWIAVIGQKEVPGRPNLYATTKTFLDYFNLTALSELPPLAELKNWDNASLELSQTLQVANREQQTTASTTEAESA